ncbi:MAG: hypothetical protein AAF693_20030 [Bacteroidota bacterium]
MIKIDNTMKNNLLRTLILASVAIPLAISGCSDDDNPDPSATLVQEGFVVVGLVDDGSVFARYFEELPSGTVDITQGTAFQSFVPSSVRDGAIFTPRTDGEPGFAKVIVNQSGEFEVTGIISTASQSGGRIAVRDSDFGVFQDAATLDRVNIFNPATFEVSTETIDVTALNSIAGEQLTIQDFIFRGDNELFSFMRTAANGATLLNAPLARMDINAGSVSNITQLEAEGTFAQIIATNRFIDETGNLYTWHAGDVNTLQSGAILKIPAGADSYDQSYNFQVPVVVNPQLAALGGFMTSFNYYANGIGFALINESLDPRISQLVEERGGFANLTPEDDQQIQEWLFTSPTGAYVEVDLEAQTATKIDGLPPLSVFDNAGMTLSEGAVYFSVSNPSVNALFRFDVNTKTASKVFDMSGATMETLIDLSQNYQ